MAAQRGKDILLKIEGAPGVFTTVAGLRARTISLNARTVDATDGDSAGRWRELLGGAGVQRAGLGESGRGAPGGLRECVPSRRRRSAHYASGATGFRMTSIV